MPQIVPMGGSDKGFEKWLTWARQNWVWMGSGGAILALVAWVAIVENSKSPALAPELSGAVAFPDRPPLDAPPAGATPGTRKSDSFSYLETSNSLEDKEAPDPSTWQPYPDAAPAARERDSGRNSAANPDTDEDSPMWERPRKGLASSTRKPSGLSLGGGSGSGSLGYSPASGGSLLGGLFDSSPSASGASRSGLLASLKGMIFRSTSKPQDPKSRAHAAAGGSLSKPAGLRPGGAGATKTSTQYSGSGAIGGASPLGSPGSPSGAGVTGAVAPDSSGGGAGTPAPGGVGGMTSTSQEKAEEDSGKSLDCEDQGGEWDSAKSRCDMSGKRRKECDLEGGDYDSKTKLCDKTGAKRVLCEAEFGHLWDHQTKQCLKDKEAVIEEKDCTARKGLWVIEPSPNCRCAPPNKWLPGVDGVQYCMNPKDATVLDQEKCRERGGAWLEGERKPCVCGPDPKIWVTGNDGVTWCMDPAATPEEKDCIKRHGEWFEAESDPCKCGPPKKWTVQDGMKWCQGAEDAGSQKCTVQSKFKNPPENNGACLRFNCTQNPSKTCYVEKGSDSCAEIQNGHELSNCPRAACPSTIDKVCGADGEPYDNACMARLGGTTVAKQGPCEAEKPCAGKGNKTTGLCADSNFWCWNGQCIIKVTCGATYCQKLKADGTSCERVPDGEQGDKPCASGDVCKSGSCKPQQEAKPECSWWKVYCD